MAGNNSTPKTLQIQEPTEGELILTTDYFFSKIGDAVPLTADTAAPFDTQTFPAAPLVFSQRFRLIFAAHSSGGFCVAKTQDVIAAAKEIKDKGDGPSVRGSSLVDVLIGRVEILALSLDSSYLAAVVGKEIHCFSIDSLLAKVQNPLFTCSVESDYVKNILWVKDTDASVIVLTNDRKLCVGTLNKSLKYVMGDIDAIDRSVDGNLLAVVRRNNLGIFSAKLKELWQILLPLNSWISDTTSNGSIKVDSVRWIRSDSIVLGCLQQTETGMEESYHVQVIMSEDSKIIDDSSRLSAVCFSDPFPGIVDDIVPFGHGPHLFMEYLEHCGLGFISNRKNTDQHIMLFAWSPENNAVSLVDIERDSWLPRIELQENGDENLVLGLCVDKTSVNENVKVKIGAEEHKELPPHCVLVCLTLEGKLIMFSVASLALSTSSNDGQSITVAEASILGGTPPLLEDWAKQSAVSSGPYDFDAKKVGIGLDETPAKKDPKVSDINKNFSNASNSDIKLRKEPFSVDNKEKALVDVETSKPLHNSEHSSLGTSNQVLPKNSHMGGSNFSKVFDGAETWKSSNDVSLTDQPFGKTMYDNSENVAEKTGSGVSPSFPNPAVPSSTLTLANASNTRSPNFSPITTICPPTNTANYTGNFPGNHRYPSDSLNSLGKGTTHGQKAASTGGVADAKFGISSLKVPSQEDARLQIPIGNSHSVKLHQKTSSLSGKISSEPESSNQFGSVQHMADELDELLECIEAAGGFKDACTTSHRSSLESLEEGLNILPERSRAWQSFTEKQLRDIQLLLDKTVQVLAREKHIEAIIKQTTDRQYWELWNSQKLSSELDLKRQNLLNLNQDLINQVIGLEKHFNALELNLFGENGGLNMVSRAVQGKRAPPRYIQSLHAIHNATISQLATAKQLSESLACQMDVLSISSTTAKKECVKKLLLESIGISCPGDCVNSPDIGRVIDNTSNKKQLVSRLDAAHNESRRNLLSGMDGHDPETARRRRDSLDRNWANFEAPKTTVKRTLMENQRKNVGGSFSSPEKRFVNPCRLEESTAPSPNFFSVQGKIGSVDMPKKLNSEALGSSIFKWAGAQSKTSKVEVEGTSKLPVVQGNSFLPGQNMPVLPPSFSSSYSSSSSSSSFMDLNIKGNDHSTTERSGAQVGNIDKFESVISEDLKPSSSLFSRDKPTFQRMQPQILPSPVKCSEISISSSNEAATTMPIGDRSSSIKSPCDALDLPTSGSPPIVASSSSAFSLSTPSVPTPSLPTLPSTSTVHGLVTSVKAVNDADNQVSKPDSSPFPASPSETYVNSLSKTSNIMDRDRMGFSANSSNSTTVPQLPADEVGVKTSLVSFPRPHSLESSGSEGFKLERLTPSTPTEGRKDDASASPLDLSGTVEIASNVLSNTQSEKQYEKHSVACALPAVPPSDSGGTIGGNFTVDAGESQEDEMEEEAPETNQTADFSLGSLSGFGLGSIPSNTTPKPNPFGGPVAGASMTLPNPVSLTVPSGELLRPASFSFPSQHASQQSQPMLGSATPTPQPSTGSGFGQPAQIGMGLTPLGSVLGSFGQSRQLGSSLPGSSYGGMQPSGGFQNATSGGGFTTAGNTVGAFGGGFAAAANSGGGFGGGFAAAGNTAGGFGGPGVSAPTVGGFAAVSNSGGFGGAASGVGFGAFSNQGSSGVPSLGSSVEDRQPPQSSLFTQMRK